MPAVLHTRGGASRIDSADSRAIGLQQWQEQTIGRLKVRGDKAGSPKESTTRGPGLRDATRGGHNML